MPNWSKWLISLVFGAAIGAGVVPNTVAPSTQNPTGMQNPVPTSNPLGTILGAIIGAGAAAGALQTQLSKKGQ